MAPDPNNDSDLSDDMNRLVVQEVPSTPDRVHFEAMGCPSVSLFPGPLDRKIPRSPRKTYRMDSGRETPMNLPGCMDGLRGALFEPDPKPRGDVSPVDIGVQAVRDIDTVFRALYRLLLFARAVLHNMFYSGLASVDHRTPGSFGATLHSYWFASKAADPPSAHFDGHVRSITVLYPMVISVFDYLRDVTSSNYPRRFSVTPEVVFGMSPTNFTESRYDVVDHGESVDVLKVVDQIRYDISTVRNSAIGERDVVRKLLNYLDCTYVIGSEHLRPKKRLPPSSSDVTIPRSNKKH